MDRTGRILPRCLLDCPSQILFVLSKHRNSACLSRVPTQWVISVVISFRVLLRERFSIPNRPAGAAREAD